MKMLTITINGRDFPCRITMGAIVRFKRLMGYDIAAVGDMDLTDQIAFFYCCVASSCAVDKIEFDLTLEEFADALDMKALEAFASSAEDEDSKKKDKR